jgi:hypothetical protein
MLKVWKVAGGIEYGWCLIVVSAENALEANEIAEGAAVDTGYDVEEWYPAEQIQGVFDHTDIPRILAQEIGCE